MKNARLILIGINLSAAVGGTFAFTCIRNLSPAFSYEGNNTWISATVDFKFTAPKCHSAYLYRSAYLQYT